MSKDSYGAPNASTSSADMKLGQPKQEEQSSRAAVTASVLFYLVAALVVSLSRLLALY